MYLLLGLVSGLRTRTEIDTLTLVEGEGGGHYVSLAGLAGNSSLGPHHHTWGKSHDHEIVRAQKNVPKGHLMTPPKSCSVVANSQVQCEAPYVTGPSTQCYFNEFLFMRVGSHT